MNLRAYLDLDTSNITRLADALGIQSAYLWQMAAGKRAINAQRCVAIENLTDRQVRREELREDWVEIWPEIRDRQARPARRRESA